MRDAGCGQRQPVPAGTAGLRRRRSAQPNRAHGAAMGGTCHPQGARSGTALLAGQRGHPAPPKRNSPKPRGAATVPEAALGTEGGREAGQGGQPRRTDLPELQGGDDHEDEAPEAEAGPIPVRQAGIGLALQEL